MVRPRSCTLPLCTAALAVATVLPAGAGLVSWWKFDEAPGATSAADSSGAVPPATATVFNGGAFQPAAGKFGGALYLDGTNDYAQVADLAGHRFPVTQSFSIALWYKSDGNETTLPGEYSTGLNQGLITKAYPGTTYSSNYYQLQLTVPASGATPPAYFVFDSRLSTAAATPFRQPSAAKTPLVVNSQWHHLAAVMDRSAKQLRLYIDGTLYHSAATSAAAGGGEWDMGSAAPLVIGNHQNRYCRGWFDDIGIWNEALTATQIATLNNNGIAGLGDTDNDGLTDSWELEQFGNLDQTGSGDPDLDSLTNLGELNAGTNPQSADTDNDGLTDGAEVLTHTTSPVTADTDSDGLTDGAEINQHGSNPKLADTDSDNWTDGEEIAAGSNPLNPASFPAPPPADLHLNEFVSENLPRPNDPAAPADMDGEYPDWLEIKNNESRPVTLTGWHLSDDPLNPGKWTFAGTTIPAGGYLVVFASGRNRAITGVQPHTNFKLSASGSLLLSRPDGAGGFITVSQIGTADAPYPAQKQTFSWGRPDNTAGAAPQFLSVPTPGTANDPANAVTGFAADTRFDVKRGIYSAPFTVTITSSTPGATISWTTNGSAPTATNGNQSPAAGNLTGPVATVNITGTTLLRARAWKAGMGSSDIDTQSYIFPAQVMTQNAPVPSMNLLPADTLAWGASGADLANLTAFPGLTFWGVNQGIATDPVPDNQFKQEDLMALPTLSLVADWKSLFGPNTAGQTDGGIYPPATGIAVEGIDRVASLELINPDASLNTPNDTAGFQTDGNIHVFGGTSQNRWKSYKLSMRFQCTQEVNYRVYGDGAANVFNNFTLDATMNNTWMHPTDANQRNRSSFVRDFVMADLQNRMGRRGFHSRPAHLYLNGLYWGVYYLHEKPDHHFNAAYYGGDAGDYDVFKHSMHPAFTESDPHVNTLPQNPALPVAKPTASSPGGNSTCVTNFEALLDLLGTGNVGPNPATVPDLAIPANYEAVAASLDIDDFIDYMLLNFLAGNQDWADKNLYAARRRTPDGKWRFFSWDAEHTFRTGAENFIAAPGNEGNPPRNGNPKQIHNRLRTSPEYRLRFADHIRRHLFNDGALTVPALTGAFNARLDEINDAVRAESARWGHIRASANGNVPYKKSNWLTERDRITRLESGGLSLIQNRWNLYMNGPSSQFRLASNGPLYPSTEAPDFTPAGGSVPAGSGPAIANPNTDGTVYYTLDGSDPRLPGDGINPSALTYAAPLALAASATVKSRILLGGTWSALTESYFSVATVPAAAGNLVISEFSYHPAGASPAEAAAGFTNPNDFEFIEIMNTGSSKVDLRNCRFTAGISFDFSSGSILELPPGGRALIVENPEAAAFRYGPGLPVAGAFTLDTGLSNSGETITLEDASGAVIQSFAYNDKAPWPEAADGGGYSLVLIRPETGPDHTLAQNWRPSATPAGNPGASDITGFASWKASRGITSDHGDDDRDGASNITEYFLKTDPASAASRPVLQGGIETFTVDPGPGLPPVADGYLTLRFNRDPGADDVTCIPEMSDNLGTWSNRRTELIRVSVTPNPDGTLTEVWRSAAPVPDTLRRYARIRITAP